MFPILVWNSVAKFLRSCQVLSLRCVWKLLLPKVFHLCLSLQLPCVFKPCVTFFLCSTVLSSHQAVQRLFLGISFCCELVSFLDCWICQSLKLYICYPVRFPSVDLFPEQNGFDWEPSCESLHYRILLSLYLISNPNLVLRWIFCGNIHALNWMTED